MNSAFVQLRCTLTHTQTAVSQILFFLIYDQLSSVRADSVSTLHHSVRHLHRGQVCDDGDIIVPAGALNVDVDGAFNLAV